MIYNKVYRYKTYEISYWNEKIAQELKDFSGEPAQYFNVWFDKLSALHLCPQIAGDVAHSFIMRHAKEMTPEVKEIVRSRSKGVLISSSQQIEDFWLVEEKSDNPYFSEYLFLKKRVRSG